MRRTPTFNLNDLARNLEKEGVEKTFARCFFSILSRHQTVQKAARQAPKIVEAEVVRETPCNDGKK